MATASAARGKTHFGVVRFARNGLRYFFREHLLVAAATAVAVAVLVGALVVGDSVRGSLRAAFTERLGATDYAVLPLHPFSDDANTGLAARLGARDDFRGRFEPAVPVYRLPGTVVTPDGGTVPATIFGVDERYFAFHGFEDVIEPGTARISSGIRRLGFAPDDGVLIGIGGHEEIASASLFGEKEDAGITVRRQVAAWPSPAPGIGSGDFALFPEQGASRAVFLPISDLRRIVDASGEGRGREGDARANALLIRGSGQGVGGPAEEAAVLTAALRETSSLDDRGLSLSEAADGAFVLESRSLVLADGVVEGALAAAEREGIGAAPVLTYLATSIRNADQETPYSLVSGLPAALLPESGQATGEDVLHPGPWLAEDLGLEPGDPLELSFLVWEDQGRFHSETASFVAGTAVAGEGLFMDGTLAPEYPGVSDSARMGDWDPPFPVDLTRIRERDELYWEEYRALPKAFVPLPVARRLWRMRQGSATSIRFVPGPASASEPELVEALVAALPAEDFGLAPVPVRQQGLDASRGATDFGLYFLYFSYFLLVSAFVLLALLYRLGVERRLREIGMLLACGWSPRRVSRNLLLEAAVVAAAGALAGALAGIAYASGMIGLLSGVWEGAVAGTLSAAGGGGNAGAALGVSVSSSSVLAGAFSGVLMALGAAWWTLRKLVRCSPRSLLAGRPAGELESFTLLAPRRSAGTGARRGALVTGAGGLALLGLGIADAIPEAGGFFGAGAALLASAFLVAWSRLKGYADPARRAASAATGSGLRGLAFRATTFRPGRSLAALILVAFAAFTLVAVEAFRKRSDPGTLPAGTGGFLSITETAFGSPWDPRDPEGAAALSILPPEDLGLRIQPLRLAGDEDASCLNLYVPSRPRVIGIPRDLAEENRFPFGAHLGESPEELENPWRLLWRDRSPEDAIPVIGDQNSMTYVLKWPVGEERIFPIGEGGAPVRLRLVATLWDSVFQGELLMAEEDLLRSLPAPDGYRLFLTEWEEAPRGEAALAAAEAEAVDIVSGAFVDYGAVSVSTRARLDEFHQVENTYLSTFQALGGLGLLLGTFGLGAVLLRNADERRQEWALLRAAGYRRGDFARLGFWENALLLSAGLAAGSIAAVIAILPVLGQRDAGGSVTLLALLLAGVLAFGLGAGALAARAAANRPILESLRAG